MRVWAILVGTVTTIGLAGCGPQLEPTEGGDSTSGSTTAEPGETGQVEETSSTTALSTSSTTSSTDPTSPATTVTSSTTGPVETGTSESSSSSTEESSSGEPPELNCNEHCEVLSPGSCFSDDSACTDACEEAIGNQGPAVADAFEECVASQPLCFSSLEDCMWGTLFGDEPVEQAYRFEGSGFDAWEGRQVYSQLLAGELTVPGTTGTIEDGEVVLDATVTLAFDTLYNPRDFYLFVDVDGDGVCTPEVDHAQTVWIRSLGFEFFENPSFVVTGEPNEVSADFVCGQF